MKFRAAVLLERLARPRPHRPAPRPSIRPAHDNGETWERRNRRKLAG